MYTVHPVHSTHTHKCLQGSIVEGNKKTSNLIIQNVESENFYIISKYKVVIFIRLLVWPIISHNS